MKHVHLFLNTYEINFFINTMKTLSEIKVIPDALNYVSLEDP